LLAIIACQTKIKHQPLIGLADIQDFLVTLENFGGK
jgi:hypothetical protein